MSGKHAQTLFMINHQMPTVIKAQLDVKNGQKENDSKLEMASGQR